MRQARNSLSPNIPSSSSGICCPAGAHMALFDAPTAVPHTTPISLSAFLLPPATCSPTRPALPSSAEPISGFLSAAAIVPADHGLATLPARTRRRSRSTREPQRACSLRGWVTSAGAVTADPRQLAGRAPGDNKLMIPAARTRGRSPGCALPRLSVITAAYPAFPDMVRGYAGVSRPAPKTGRGWPASMTRPARPGRQQGPMW